MCNPTINLKFSCIQLFLVFLYSKSISLFVKLLVYLGTFHIVCFLLINLRASNVYVCNYVTFVYLVITHHYNKLWMMIVRLAEMILASMKFTGVHRPGRDAETEKGGREAKTTRGNWKMFKNGCVVDWLCFFVFKG